MAFPTLNEYLNYGKIPLLYLHRREGLHKYYNDDWEELTFIPDWENLDLNGTFVQTTNTKLIDPEIVLLTRIEKKAVIDYYQRKGRNLTLCSSYIVRDNHSGSVFLPQDCQVYSP
uniref:Uncharacterized protein n=1 Tax=Panagrolaimus davidi TaxID=227884 RepID=A0A914QVA7_9BILA